MNHDLLDPIKLQKQLWPDKTFYREQRDILYSIKDNKETFVPAGNMVGKDYVAGYAVLWFVLSCVVNDCSFRVITTSVKGEHLDVLWGEIDSFLRSANRPLTSDRGGPLQYNDLEIRKIDKDGALDKHSYLKGQMSKKGEGFSGHHAERTLFVVDEASAVEQKAYEMAQGWAEKIFVFGNPHPCPPGHFFYDGVRNGDVRAENNGRFNRKVIRIKADQSPNVRFALEQERAGITPTNEVLIPGLLTYDNYLWRRQNWSPYLQCIGLDAEFPEDLADLLFPPENLNRAEQIADSLRGQQRSGRKWIGADTAMGGDSTVWVVSDSLGVLDLVSKKTPDTAVIKGETLALMHRWGVRAEDVLFDAGGGGQNHADYLRQDGHNVRTVAFGESAKPPKRRGMTPIKQRIKQDEEMFTYKNRRAQLYGLASLKLDPAFNPRGFGIPSEYVELRRQLAPIPKQYDREGQLWLPPKRKPPKTSRTESNVITMGDLIGCSPDEADAFCLSIFGQQQPTKIVLRPM